MVGRVFFWKIVFIDGYRDWKRVLTNRITGSAINERLNSFCMFKQIKETI